MAANPEVPAPLYDTDYYSWTLKQAELLRAGRFDKLDLDNLIDEVEDLGNRHKDQLYSRYVKLLQHLLKWKYQPERQSGSWHVTIVEQRSRLARLIKKNPGLQSEQDTAFADAYADARKQAAAETGLDKSVFPEVCEWTITQAMTDDWLPGGD